MISTPLGALNLQIYSAHIHNHGYVHIPKLRKTFVHVVSAFDVSLSTCAPLSHESEAGVYVRVCAIELKTKTYIRIIYPSQPIYRTPTANNLRTSNMKFPKYVLSVCPQSSPALILEHQCVDLSSFVPGQTKISGAPAPNIPHGFHGNLS